MTMLVVFYAVGNRYLWASTARAWLGFEHFAVLIYLGAIALRDFRASTRLANRTPVSEYHRREVLPERLTGALLVANLQTTRVSDPDHEGLHAWRALLYAAVFRAGGTVIYRHGHDVMAFFDQSRCPSPAVSALTVIRDVAQASALVKIESHGPHSECLVRSSLVLGEIRPVWEETGDHREPYWEEAGHSTPFVEASRLLEVGPPQPGPAVFVKEEVARELENQGAGLQAEFAARDLHVTDKHGQPYRVAVYRPERPGKARSAA